jgi:hypothetical protein
MPTAGVEPGHRNMETTSKQRPIILLWSSHCGERLTLIQGMDYPVIQNLQGRWTAQGFSNPAL